MTTTTLRTATLTSDRPTSTAGAPEPGGPRRHRHRRRVATVGIVAGGTLVAVAAVGAGVLLGQRATSTRASAVGTP